MSTVLTLLPAYGRDYKSKQAAIDDWNANKDFVAVGFGGGGNINKEDAISSGVAEVKIRYKKQTMFVVVKVTP